MWANLKACGTLLWALGLFAGCGKTGTSESGETHFVSCNTDADCTGVTDAHTCDGGFCRGPANDDNSPSDKTPACESGCAGSECATPGSCSLAAACKVVDCGTAVFDDEACVRPSCEDDTGCPADERCATAWWSRHYQCVQTGNACECQAGLGLLQVDVCSPVSLAGPRGRWEKLVVTETIIGDSTVRTFMPDGSVTLEQHSLETGMIVPTTAQLTAEDLDNLTRTINGASLRRKLVDATVCPVTKARDDIVELYLTDGNGSSEAPALSKNVAGCLAPPNEVPEFSNIIVLASKY